MTQRGSAWSIGAHSFQFTAVIGAGLDVGGYVRLDLNGGASYLGQIIDIAASDAGVEIARRPLTWRIFVFSALLFAVMLTVLDVQRATQGLIRVDQSGLQAALLDMETRLR